MIPLSAQDTTSDFYKAMNLYRSHLFDEAVPLLEQLLVTDSTNITLLNAAANSLAAPNYTNLSFEAREKKYRRALELAGKAVKIDPKSSMAHYNVGLALGRLSEGASTKVKVSLARQIRLSCEEALRLNPSLSFAMHIMGRWHREVAGFSMLEQKMIALFFGKGIEGGTYEEAIRYFKEAMKLDPQNQIHYLELGITYMKRDEDLDSSYAKAYIKKAIEMPIRYPEDAETRQRAIRVLKEMDE